MKSLAEIIGESTINEAAIPKAATDIMKDILGFFKEQHPNNFTKPGEALYQKCQSQFGISGMTDKDLKKKNAIIFMKSNRDGRVLEVILSRRPNTQKDIEGDVDAIGAAEGLADGNFYFKTIKNIKAFFKEYKKGQIIEYMEIPDSDAFSFTKNKTLFNFAPRWYNH